MPRRSRRLTPEEARLWNSVARTTRRLGQAALAPPEAPAPPEPATTPPPRPSAPAPPAPPPGPLRPQPRAAASRTTSLDLAPDPMAELAAAPARLDRRRFDRMMRGKLAPEGRLDLHGMTRPDAHAALIDFVLTSQARGRRLVLVITGKGRPDGSDSLVPERQGILRHSLPHWLHAPPLTGRVIEIRPAHARHGGAGAVYLYLRRRT